METLPELVVIVAERNIRLRVEVQHHDQTITVRFSKSTMLFAFFMTPWNWD